MEDTRARWERAFLEAQDFDTWGQVEEAIEGYQRLQIAAAAEYVENVLMLPIHRRDGIGKLAAALKQRVQELQQGNERGIGLSGMKSMKPFMKEMIITDAVFPLANVKPEAMLGPMIAAEPDEGPVEEYEEELQGADGTLRGPPRNLRPGDALLVLYIDKWGFKDATSFYEPRVVISVRDANGEVLEAIQETPMAKANTHNHMIFENTVYIQTPLNRLPASACIFFEFRHFKIKKQKKSTKAYCFLEMDEIKNGPVQLEIYKKPAIYRRDTKPSLLSVKPLYLHLELEVEMVEGQ